MNPSDAMAEVRSLLGQSRRRYRALPPATSEQVQQMETLLGGALPRELQEFLWLTQGFDWPYPLMLTGRRCGLYELFPHAMHLQDDGYGNEFVYDVGGPDSDPARVLFSCHDPPVVIFLTPSLWQFILWAIRAELNQPGPLERLESWFEVFCEAGPGGVVRDSQPSVLEPGQRIRLRLSADSHPGDGFWWAAAGAEFAAKRIGHGCEFEVWRDPD